MRRKMGQDRSAEGLALMLRAEEVISVSIVLYLSRIQLHSEVAFAYITHVHITLCCMTLLTHDEIGKGGRRV